MDQTMDRVQDLTPEDGELPEPRMPGRELYEWLRSLVTALLIIILTFTFVVRMMGVKGPSMIPTLQDGDRLLVLDRTLAGEYRQGDIVIARKESFSNDRIFIYIGIIPFSCI